MDERQVAQALGYAALVGERLQSIQASASSKSRKVVASRPFSTDVMQTQRADSFETFLPTANDIHLLDDYLAADASEAESLKVFTPQPRKVQTRIRKKQTKTPAAS